ncbi:hypothetical protein FRC03_006718 [Tulasnella sp. 419]|nr:hypothetical protein FRC03_006718 [Tulasnella sp. 419]
MPIIERIKDAAIRLMPEKRSTLPMPVSGGLGHGIASFDDDLILSKPLIIFYACQIFFSFLAMACFASVASFQAKWNIGPSGLSSFAIFTSVSLLLGSAVMLAVPVLYEKYNKLTRLARAMQELRVHFILTASGVIFSLLISFITTISAWTQPGCKDPSKDPNEKLGDDFKIALPGWCRTKKAGAVFFWIAFIAWAGTLGLAIKDWRSGKLHRPRDPPFTHPIVDTAHDDESSYYPANRDARQTLTTHEEEEEEEDQSPFNDPQPRYGEGPAPSLPPVDVGPRPSVEVYGAFSDPAPTGYGNTEGVSRTMQYADPYAAVRANIGGPRSPGQSQPPPTYQY